MGRNIFGIDLGTNSVGWAVIEVDQAKFPLRILGMGSRIIPLSADERDQFQRGQAISKNQDRTRMRTQRKGYDRRGQRKFALRAILKALNMYPSPELMALPAPDLWKLRYEAARAGSELTPQQLGRVLYHLNQKRGYKSMRSIETSDSKETEYVKEVMSRYDELKMTGQTFGQLMYEGIDAARKTNNYFHIKKKVYPRKAHEEEFDRIMDVQKSKHPALTEEIIKQLRDNIIFFSAET